MEKHRSRLVAQHFNTGADPTMFAATPLIEAIKMIISDAATGNEEQRSMVNDASHAYVYAPVGEPVYVKLCSGDQLPGEEGLCGRLNKAMYGTRPAAQNWLHEFTDVLTQAGFVAGTSNPWLFFHSGRCLHTFVHGDDFVTSGKHNDLGWLKSNIEERYKSRTSLIGERQGLDKEKNVLNRLIRWHQGIGRTLEAGPRYVRVMIEGMRCERKSPLKAPAARAVNRIILR